MIADRPAHGPLRRPSSRATPSARPIAALAVAVAFSAGALQAADSLEAQLDAARETDSRWECIELIQRLAAKNRASREHEIELATLQIQVSDLERAAATIARLEKNGSDDLHVVKARLASAQDDRKTEIAELRAAADVPQPDVAIVAELVTTCLLENSKESRAEALERAEQLVKLEKTAPHLMLRCRAKLAMHDWQGAKADCAEANALDASASEVRGWFPAFERLDAEGGLAKLAQLEKTKDRVGQARILADAEFFSPADDLLTGVISRDTPEIALRLFYAGVLVKAGARHKGADLGVIFPGVTLPLPPDKLAAIERCDAAVLERATADSLFERAWHLNDVGQHLLALEDCQAALALQPDEPRALTEAAYASFKLDRPKDALDFITEATAQTKATADMWRIRGDIETACARHADAVTSYEKSLALRNSRDVRLALERTKLIVSPK